MPNLAVIGYPVGHSRSPTMQTAALTEMKLAGEWTYGALEVAPEDFEAEVAELAAAGEYAGVNVTVPHKEAALAMADAASEAARAIGAANTLSFRDGQIAADNTDAGGLLRSLPHLPEGANALVLGAGGAARAAIWGLADAGATVDVWNRTEQRGESVARELGARFVADPDPADYSLIVNTTAVGLGGEDPFEHLPLSADSFNAEQVVVDMVYGDEPSPLLTAAAAAGATTVDGLEMLVQQGALSLQIWTGEEPSLEAMRAAVRL
ncbi:MAG: shikimate dehydrogenase [Actinobacteria bacterium]|nr:shikimate dehydrogenase [Actinomycetota bacterium]